MKPSVYLETTVISYLAARPSTDLIVAGRQALTRMWWDDCRDHFRLLVSESVLREAAGGDESAAAKRLALLEDIDSLAISDEVVNLAERLVNEGPIPQTYAEDALHIDYCGIHGVDFLLTWNCKHIANAAHYHEISGIMLKHDIQCPVICTPEELMET